MLKKLFLVLSLLIITAQLVSACSCMPHAPLTIKDFNETSTIFIGKVKSITAVKKSDGDDQNEITFELQTIFKGLPAQKEVKVYTNLSSAACGLYVQKGQNWLLYAHVFKGVLSTNRCSRSNNLAFAKANELELLKSFSNHPKQKTWMVNGVKRGEGLLINNLPTGKWRYFYADGSLAEEGNYTKGELDGRWTKYVDVVGWENRLKNSNRMEKDTKLNREDFLNRIETITNYKMGKVHGEFIEYDVLSSKITRLITYVNDQEEGLSINYYTSGLIETLENFKKGELDGISRAYYPNGQLMYEGKYWNGTSEPFKAFNEEGKFIGTSVRQPYYDPEKKKLELFNDQ